MKRNILSLGVLLLFATVLFNACKSDEPGGGTSTTDGGVVINGVKWATRNVGSIGTFVTNPEDFGGLYQWNRKDTANFLLDDDYWASPFLYAAYWLPANDPSPSGWRVPTAEEFESLLNTEKVTNEWTVESGIYGMRFTDKVTNKSIFLPAAGIRSYWDGKVEYGRGSYWSSTQSDDFSVDFGWYSLFFSDWYGCNGSYDGYPGYGMSVRPVAK